MSKNDRKKKSSNQKLPFLKVVRKFTNLVTNFFYFDEISKMRVLQPKNALLKGTKNHWVKKVIKSKKTLIKVVRNFAI